MYLTKSKFGYFSLLFIFLGVFLLAGCGETNTTFNVTGRVISNGNPVANVLITTDLGTTTTTDENGNFAFSNLDKATLLSFSADGYVFQQENIAVYQETKNIEVNAEKKYTLKGRVVSDNMGIAGATVVTNGLVNVTATTDSKGYFSIENIAGETRVSVAKENFLFEDKIATIDNCNLVFSGTTSVTATVKGAEGATLTINNKKLTYSDGVYSASGIALGSVLIPVLNGYHFEPSQMVITRENQNVEFTAYKTYTVTGTALSGSNTISGVTVKVNGDAITTTNSAGQFTISGLWGDNILNFSHSVFKFNSVEVSDAQNLELNGTFTLTGYVYTGISPVSEVYVSSGAVSSMTDTSGKFSLNGISLGATVTFQKDGYIIDTLQITDTTVQNVTATALFDARITVLCDGEPLENASVLVDGKNYTTDSYGVVEFNDFANSFVANISLDGYTSEQVNITRENNQITVNLRKIYDLTINIHSGDIILNGAQVYYNGVVQTVEGNTLKIEGLNTPLEVRVLVDGYNALTLTGSAENANLDFDLSYNVNGTVSNGSLSVDAEIVATDKQGGKITARTDKYGIYEITLKGTNTLTANATNLNFTDCIVKGESTQNFAASYDISGSLTAEGEAVSGATVLLISADTHEQQAFTTEADGKYSFSNLAGAYVLMIENATVELMPKNYEIISGGIYNFDASGYSISGKVLNGSQGVAGVTIRAGDTTVTTNENGEFTFDLLMGNVTVTAIKTGYTFDRTFELTPENDGEQIVFNATYMVEGYVKSGNTSLENVKVIITDGKVAYTDSAGYFKIEGLTDTNTLEFEKTGYTINSIKVSGYQNLELQATFSISGTVKVGENALSGVVVSNGTVSTTTNEAGEFTLSGISAGENIIATKSGYTFNTIIATEYGQNFAFSGTFSVSGIVKSNGRAVSGVAVVLGDLNTTTDSAGRFAFANVSEYGTMTFTLSGYTFTPVEVNGPLSNIEVLATFAVNGHITLNGQGVSGVSVSANGQSTTTDESGYFNLTGLDRSGWLTVEKEGYDFVGEKYFSGATTLDFTSTYWVIITVSSGSLSVDGVLVTSTNGTVEEMGNGKYTIRGLLNNTTVTAEANGYNPASLDITGYAEGLVLTLTYDVKLSIAGAALDNITLKYTDENGEYSQTFGSTKYVIKNIVGAGEWSLDREGYLFSPESGTYTVPKTVDITYQAVYNINGRVTVANSNVGVSGMAITFGENSTTTDANGYYTLNDLVGEGQLRGVLSATNCDTILVSVPVTTEGTYNLTINNNDYVLWLIQKGYQNLREADGYINTTHAEVANSMSSENQIVGGLKKKDKTGKYIAQNLNIGSAPVVGDVSVAFTSYYDSVNSPDIVDYKLIKGSSNISQNGDWYDINYAALDWTNTTISDYQNNIMGGRPDGLTSYIINKSTITQYGNISLNNGDYTFTINLNPSTAVSNYLKQVKTLSNQNPTFDSIEMTYTVGTDGNLKSVSIHEKYHVKITIITVNIEGWLTETFQITDGEDLINKTDYEINELN